MILNWLFFAAVGFAFMDWAATWKGWKLRLYIAKPATLLCLILWSLSVTGWHGGMIWFGVGLIFSLLGDIILMLNPRFFMAGVGAFFFAHASYIVGFNQSPAPTSLGVMLIAILVGVAASRVFRLIKPGILRVPRGKRFLTASIAYGLIITLMLLAALLTLYRPDWTLTSALLVVIGASLFYISDILLAYDRFIHKFTHAQSVVHLTYHLGQFGLIAGAALHYLK